jgi:hypothetical protein
MEALVKPSFHTNLFDSVRNAPLAWAGAVMVAVLPVAVVAFKREAPVTAVAAAPEATPSVATRTTNDASSWFSGADNPFLTEEQARERRLRASVARVEEVLRRRPDVLDVTVLTAASGDARANGPSAVVTIHMREGVVPLPLVDATGTLLAAAVPGLKAQDVTVIDEVTGIRARAAGLDEQQSAEGRQALVAAQAAAPRSAATVLPVARAAQPALAASTESGWNTAVWVGGFAAAVAVVVMAYRWRTAPSEPHLIQPASSDDPITGTLSMAFHRSVAEQSALIATALVERLEQRGTSANEVAQLLLNLEPWAAERLLKGMPPESLAKVEEALRDPTGDAPTSSIRALAEAVLSVRAAA